MKKLKVNEDNAEYRFANWMKVFVDIVKPKNLYLIGGRGTAKTTDILAERTIDICYDMPRAPFAFVADTYVNLLTNIIPSITTAWRERKKWIEYDTKNRSGHFVVDERPPAFWKQPYSDTYSYKHTITTFMGNKFFMLSLDRASISAGISVVHHFIDEAKFSDPKKINKLFPTLRGDANMFGNSHYFLGQTITTDMPNPYSGDFSWILDLEKNMDKTQIIQIIQTAFIVNDILKEYVDVQQSFMPNADIEKVKRKLERWQERLTKIRKNSTLFYVVSSFANIDVLTLDYIKNLFNTLPWEEFKVAVLSLSASISKETRFYVNFGNHLLYEDGYLYEYYDAFSLKDSVLGNITQTSAGLRYIRNNLPLEAGFDAGNMMSLVIGQDHNTEYRILKNIYTVSPSWIRELADEFIRFFKPHNNKTLYLYFDRSANNYKLAKEDFASKLKNNIEKDKDGNSTGWTVRLMSENQRNITHVEEYDLMLEFMSGRFKGLPKLFIDAYECKELISSVRNAPQGTDSKGKIKKIKRSEKLPLDRLPMESTNFSDAFKYLVCRPKWLSLVKNKTRTSIGLAQVRNT